MTTITIGEFLKECEAYPYSRERYEIVKESIEIDLMSLYLENYEYIKECKEYDEEIHESVMFTEATEEVAEDKAESLIKKIWNGILKILKALARPFVAIAGFVKTMIDRIRNKAPVSEKKATEIIKTIPEIVKDDPDISEKFNKIIFEFIKGNKELYESIKNQDSNVKYKDSDTGADVKNKKTSGSINLKDDSHKIFLNKLTDFIYGHNYQIPRFFTSLQTTCREIKDYFGRITSEHPAGLNNMRKYFNKKLNTLKSSLQEQDDYMTYDALMDFTKEVKDFKDDLARIFEELTKNIMNFGDYDVRVRYKTDLENLKDLHGSMSSFLTFINSSMKDIYFKCTNIVKDHEKANNLLNDILNLFK